MNFKVKVFILISFISVLFYMESTAQDVKLHSIEYYNSIFTYYFFSDTESKSNKLIEITDMLLDDKGELFMVGRFTTFRKSIIRKHGKDFLRWKIGSDESSFKNTDRIMKAWDGSLCSLSGTATFLRPDYSWSRNYVRTDVPNGRFVYMDKKTGFWIREHNYDGTNTDDLYYKYGNELKLVLDSIPERSIVTEDRKENIWLANKRGIFKISPDEPFIMDSLSTQSFCSKLRATGDNSYEIIRTKDKSVVRSIKQLVFTENNKIWGNIDGEVAYYKDSYWFKVGNRENNDRFHIGGGLLIPYLEGIFVVRYDNIYYVTDSTVTALLTDEQAKYLVPISPDVGVYDQKNHSLWLGGLGLVKIQLSENIIDLQNLIRDLPSRDSLINMSKEDLRIARNEVFARKGYVFKSEDMNNYFQTQEWYKPLGNNKTISLSPSELHRVNYVKSIEDEKKNTHNGDLLDKLSGFFRIGEEIVTTYRGQRSDRGVVPFIYHKAFNKSPYKLERSSLYYNFISSIGVFDFSDSFKTFLIQHQYNDEIISISNDGGMIDTCAVKNCGDNLISKKGNFIEIERTYYEKLTKEINDEEFTVDLENHLIKLKKSNDYKFLTCIEHRYSKRKDYRFYDYYYISDSGSINYMKVDSLKISKGRKYPFVSGKVVSEDELSKYSKDELRLMRNEIFADHGYIFKSQDFQNYFKEQKWYTAEKKDISLEELNIFEKENLNTILLLEKKKEQ